MPEHFENCPRCGKSLAAPSSEALEERVCPHCGGRHLLVCFPSALARQPEIDSAHPALSGTEARCYFHPNHLAAETCQACGRLICGLCALRVAGGVYCPGCLERIQAESADPALRNEYTRQDRIALALAVLPFGLSLCGAPLFLLNTEAGLGMMAALMAVISFGTVPMTLYLIFRNWSTHQTAFGPARGRLVAAGVIAGLQVSAWLAVIAGVALGFLSALTESGNS